MSTASRVYLITAGSGIGAATARSLAGPGNCFYMAGLASQSGVANDGERLAEELRGLGSEAEFHAGDLTDPTVAPAIVSGCLSRFNRIDALFNVAGGSGRKWGDGPIHECTEEGWARTMETNATTQYRMCRETVKIMLRQSRDTGGVRGTILNMSSILALHPDATHFKNIAYAASKGAVLAMTRTMAATYAREGIRVNAVAPGLVRTAMSSRASEDPAIVSSMQDRQPLSGDLLTAEAVASVCAHLLSAGSHAVTGQVVNVDAGWSLT